MLPKLWTKLKAQILVADACRKLLRIHTQASQEGLGEGFQDKKQWLIEKPKGWLRLISKQDFG